MPLYYDLEPERDIETVWVCSVAGCNACCFDKEFKEHYGCAVHGDSWIRVVREYQNGRLVSEFRESPNN